MGHGPDDKAYLLDPRFQLKWTSYLVVAVVLVMSGLGFVIARTAGRTSDTAQVAVHQAELAFRESLANSVLARESVHLAGGDDPNLTKVLDDSLADVDAQSSNNLREVRRRQEEIAADRTRLQRMLMATGGALIVLLTLMGIFITNRIVRPVHKMKKLLRRVGTGRLVIEERLRRGDELADLFDAFLQMTYSLRAMQTARLKTLDATIAKAEASGTSTDVLDGLHALRAQMVLGLERRPPSAFPHSTV
jgi:nitrogen fixation/metabolism regulation signal transduction histidine kinase